MKLSIALRLRASLALLVLIVLAVSGTSLWQMNQMRNETEAITKNWLPSVELVNQINTNTSDYQVTEFRHVLNTEDAAMANIEKIMAKIKADFDQKNETYARLISSPEERRLYESFMQDWHAYMDVHDKVLPLSRKNINDQARALLEGDGIRLFNRASDTLDELIAINHKGAVDATTRSDNAFDSAKWVVISAVGIALVVGTALSWWLVRSVIGPLEHAVEAADRVATGDLATPIATGAEDETGRLLQALSSMQANLVETVTSVRSTSSSIALGSGEIAAGNAELGRRTETQAATVEQTAASMEQLNATLKGNAETARNAAQIAETASATAATGGNAVRDVVATMENISTASRRIVDIIAVIDGIAFQTNILALNAAVEAARAGEQGRGFAVVAGEVRSLAQRCTTAASEIKGLISDSAEKVDAGSRQVDFAGRTMDDIVAQVQQVSKMIGQISIATLEQTEGIAQVSDAVTQLDQATQQNAALVEESSAATESLNRQATQLVESVRFFRLQVGA